MKRKITIVALFATIALPRYVNAQQNLEANDVSDATKDIQAAGNDRDKMLRAYAKRADVQRERNSFADAAKDYLQVLALIKQGAKADAVWTRLQAYRLGQIESDYLDQPDQAIDHFNLALEGHPDWSDAIIARAWARFNKGDLNGAEADMKIAKALNKPDWKTPYLDSNLAVLNKAIYGNPNDGEARRKRGAYNLENLIIAGKVRPENLSAAQRDLSKAAHLAPNSAILQFDLGLLAIVQKKYDLTSRIELKDIEANFKRALELDPNYLPTYAAYALYLTGTSPDYAEDRPLATTEAEDEDEKAADAEIEARTSKLNAEQNAERDRHFKEASTLLQKATEFEPKDGIWPYLQAEVEREKIAPDNQALLKYYSDAAYKPTKGLPREMSSVWQDILPFYTLKSVLNLDSEFKAAILGNRAQIYTVQGAFDKAIPDLDVSLDLNSEDKNWRFLRATIYWQKKNWDGVISDVSIVLGETKAQKPKEPGEINLNFDDLLTGELDFSAPLSEANVTEARLLRGMAYDQKGDFVKAQTDINEALKRDPKVAQRLMGTRYEVRTVN